MNGGILSGVTFDHLTSAPDADLFLPTLATIAPGTALRDGFARILNGDTGALVVLGHDDVVEAMTGGGFDIDVEFNANRLRELAKMDGAIVLNPGCTRIIRAGVQLLPDGSLPTEETGTRHRTADRVSQQTEFAVVSVSKSMRTVAIYVDGHRHEVEGSASILSRANQALATMERYKDRLNEVSGVLSELEIEDMVTVRDVVVVAQRIEMVRRIGAEIADYVIELGSDGRLLSLQHAELIGGVADELVLIAQDSVPDFNLVDSALAELETLSASELLDLERIATAFGLGTETQALDSGLTPRGYRILSRVPRLPEFAIERLVDYFDDVQGLLSATPEQLQAVDGIGETRALAIREGLARLVDSTFR